MRTRIILALVILFTLLLTSCAQTGSLTEEEMISIVKDLEAATNADDIEAVMALLTDSVVILLPDDVEFPGKPTGRFEGKDEAREFYEYCKEIWAKLVFSNFQTVGNYLMHDLRVTFRDASLWNFTERRFGFEGGKINYLGP